MRTDIGLEEEEDATEVGSENKADEIVESVNERSDKVVRGTNPSTTSNSRSSPIQLRQGMAETIAVILIVVVVVVFLSRSCVWLRR